MSALLQAVRRWWYDNEPGPLELDGFAVTRSEVLRYGGPASDLSGCAECQRAEWISRLYQRPYYGRDKRHTCAVSDLSRERCVRQGDRAWTNWHQDHFFACGIDDGLNAPRGAFLFHDSASQYDWFLSRNCNAGMATFRQRVAYACQADIEARLESADWGRYDFAYLILKGDVPLVERPPVPLIVYAHDPWRGNKQAALDHYRPALVVTPFPTLWRQRQQIPDGTRLVFLPACPSPFFARPNLDPARKRWDLLAIGALGSEFYVPRREFNAQLERLPSRFTVEHAHAAGAKRARWFGPLDDGEHCYMDWWQEKLGAARFVAFGPCAGDAWSMVLIKYYECLMSGAVPIMPRVPDLNLLGLVPWEHYIPFDAIADDNARLALLLDNYVDFQYVAVNAVAWYEQNAHALVFGAFEDVVREATGERYPPRLV